MLVDKDAVTDALRARGDHDRAAQADAALPRHVDTESDAGLLHQFDLNVAEVEASEADGDEHS
ncbi:MAG: hypothetical protein ACXWW7_08385 [Nocardioides sp.]